MNWTKLAGTFKQTCVLGKIWLSNNILFTLYSHVYELAIMQKYLGRENTDGL